ncbi:MAG: transporter substrate-binding domain-containing protein [Alphaproteobacteria bacterium]|nr:transporter substrate-binding domain-containing protein [Alphaproteobacteria bacterium]
MLSRRELVGGLAAVAAVRRRGARRSPSPPSPPPPPPNEPNLARILRTKRLRVAGLTGEEPYSYKDPASGSWAGIYITMAQNLGTDLGIEITVVESNWADQAADVHAGKVDLSYLSPTTQRAMSVDFANPLFYDTYAIVARKGWAKNSWAEINAPETVIAVDSGSAREEASRRFAGNAAITGFKTPDEALAAVRSGREDCLVTTVLHALTALKKDPQLGQLIVPSPHLRAAICPAIPYDSDRRFRGVVDAWTESNRGFGRIREWVLADLAKSGIEPGDLPPEISF